MSSQNACFGIAKIVCTSNQMPCLPLLATSKTGVETGHQRLSIWMRPFHIKATGSCHVTCVNFIHNTELLYLEGEVAVPGSLFAEGDSPLNSIGGLCADMIAMNPNDRPTINQVLLHPFWPEGFKAEVSCCLPSLQYAK